MLARRAAPADIPQLLPLIERYWQFEGIGGFDPVRIAALLRRLCTEPALGSVWLAETGARVSGYLVAVSVLSLEHGGLMAEIDELFVLPEARGQGVGGALLQQLEASLAADRCVRLQLQLGVGNQPARAFYERRGFRDREGYLLLDKVPG